MRKLFFLLLSVSLCWAKISNKTRPDECSFFESNQVCSKSPLKAP